MRTNNLQSWQWLVNRAVFRHFQQFHRAKPRANDASPGEGTVSRRTFMQGTATAAGLALSTSLWIPKSGLATPPVPAAPQPIPGGVSPFGVFIHHFPFPGQGGPGTELSQIPEPSQITDFNGFVGNTQIRGAGTGTGFASPLAFGADMGFMQGEYIGEDDWHYHGTFGFI